MEQVRPDCSGWKDWLSRVSISPANRAANHPALRQKDRPHLTAELPSPRQRRPRQSLPQPPVVIHFSTLPIANARFLVQNPPPNTRRHLAGSTTYSTNRHGMAGELENMPELRNAVEAAGHHGGCAEVGCLIQAYRAEGPSAITGGIMRTVNVRNPMSSRAGEHGTPAFPCGRCQRLLGLLGISWSQPWPGVVVHHSRHRSLRSSKPQDGHQIDQSTYRHGLRSLNRKVIG